MKVARHIVLALSGLALGVVGVEAMFRHRDHGAFPHLNVYVADPTLGVRLRPGATEKISFSGNPVTSVRINAQGYRGADWVESGDEIFVVGDSQAFGLGVEEGQRFSSVLGEELHRAVANAAVPTYGPAEYEAILKEELPRRKPKTVVYVVNLANDLFEASHPNPERHAVWDGWAVRKETAPTHVTSFPGRELLYRDSHAFFALRRALHDGASDAGSVPSEGTWRDIAKAGSDARQGHAAAEAAGAAERAKKEAQLRAALDSRKQLDAVIDKAIQADDQHYEDWGLGTLHAAHAQPGDIVRTDYGEGSSAVTAIAAQLAEAAKVRAEFEQKLKDKKDKATLDALSHIDALDKEVRTLSAATVDAGSTRSPLHPFLERASALCKANGAELVVLVLPLDVQVSQAEWAKYHAQPIDMSASRALADDVLSDAASLGARVVDAWPALAKAEPGAFLEGDLHMTPKGHAAVADAIAAALTTRTTGALPPVPIGRSPVPLPSEWSSPDPKQNDLYWLDDLRRGKCTVKVAREWTKLTCGAGRFVSTKPGHSDVLITNGEQSSSAVFATVENDAWLLSMRDVHGTDTILIAEYAIADDKAFLRSVTSGKKPMPELTDGEKAVAACVTKLGADPKTIYGAPQPGCLAYGDDCAKVLACIRADDSAPPLCAADEKIVGVTHRCSK